MQNILDFEYFERPTGRMGTLEEALGDESYEKVYIMLGINDCSTREDRIETFLASMRELLDLVKEQQPKAKVYLLSLAPVGRETPNNLCYNLDNVILYSQAVKLLSREYGAEYLDVFRLMADGEGYLLGEYDAGDGIHIQAARYENILEFLRCHICPSPLLLRPGLSGGGSGAGGKAPMPPPAGRSGTPAADPGNRSIPGPGGHACHAHRGRTRRTEVLYAAPGTLYVYLCYGIHWLLNIVTGREEEPQAVLIRSCQGAEGPGRLTRALEIGGEFNRRSILTCDELWLEDDGVSYGVRPATPGGNRLRRPGGPGQALAICRCAEGYQVVHRGAIEDRRELLSSRLSYFSLWCFPARAPMRYPAQPWPLTSSETARQAPRP